MKVYKNKLFNRFAKQENISNAHLLEAVDRAENGQIDANLGGGVIKQRIARQGRGKSSGYRTIVLFKKGEKFFFVYGFAKNERDNISAVELKAFKELANEMLNYSEDVVKMSVKQGKLIEVKRNE